MSKNELQVVKSNQVIEASYQLSTVEQRLVLAAISRIPKAQQITDDVVYLVGVADLQSLGVNETTAYRDLKDGLNRLYERSINLKIDNESIKMRWVQSVRFMDSQGVIGLRFSKEILPFISNLSREFTKYALSDIAGMSSAYAIRVYELISQYREIGKREIAVADLRQMLELGTRYPLFADFKRWVVDIAVEQINTHSPLQVSYQLRKTGRRYTHITLFFKEKNIEINPDLIFRNHSNYERSLSKKQVAALAKQLVLNPEFGSKYAYIGENSEQFFIRIKNDLENRVNTERYRQYLSVF